jgi:hypothetical protein
MSHSPPAVRHTVVAATGEQVPTDPGFTHESHTPALHAALQQMPSAQKLVPHSSASPHGWPLGFLSTQMPAEQNWLLGH